MTILEKIETLLVARGLSFQHFDLSGSSILRWQDEKQDYEYVDKWNEAILGPFPTVQDGFTGDELKHRVGTAVFPVVHTAHITQVNRDAAFTNDTERMILVERLRNATPAQIRTYMNNNVTDLASARLMLTRLALVLATIVRK